MDKKSRLIINTLKNAPYKYIFYSEIPESILKEMTDDDFFAAVRYLEKEGFIEFISNQNNTHIGVTLSHLGRNSREILFNTFLRWLFRDYLGGVVIGVTGTIFAEILLCLILSALGIKILPMIP